MAYHVVCRNCRVEGIVVSEERAADIVADHREETMTDGTDPHDILYGSVPEPVLVSESETVEPTVK